MSLVSHVHEDSVHKLGHDVIAKYYANDATHVKHFPVIPAPSLFDFDEPPPSKPKSSPSSLSAASTVTADDAAEDGGHRLPNVAECATHLVFLQTLYVLRHKILVSTDIDKALELSPNRETKKGKKGDTKTFKDNTWWERRQVKWDVYLRFAVVRFLAWKDSLPRAAREKIVTSSNGACSIQVLPPLDVLMVWHAFLLNPRRFREICGEQIVYRAKFPWKAIRKAIDTDTWSFNLPVFDAKDFEISLGLHADLYAAFRDWVKPVTNHVRKISGRWTPIPLKDFQLDSPPRSFRPAPATVAQKMVNRCAYEFGRANAALAKLLKDAVIRQASFVDKMNAHLWIRSPAARGTLRRAILRYNNFLTLLALSTPPAQAPRNALTDARPPATTTLVPTLDIDLVWHTHQTFSGQLYFASIKARVGRFINHDDTIGKGDLGDGYGETRSLWKTRFGREYKICGCWDCEAMTDGVEALREKAALLGTDPAAELKALAARVSRDVSVYRLAEIRRRKKHDVPTEATG